MFHKKLVFLTVLMTINVTGMHACASDALVSGKREEAEKLARSKAHAALEQAGKSAAEIRNLESINASELEQVLQIRDNYGGETYFIPSQDGDISAHCELAGNITCARSVLVHHDLGYEFQTVLPVELPLRDAVACFHHMKKAYKERMGAGKERIYKKR